MDWDGDGYLDIIVGDRPGNVHFFKRLDYGNIYMEEQELLAVAGQRIDIGYNSSPSIVDWNGNGLPDLVIGRLNPIPAGVLLLVNEGTPYSPNYMLIDTVFHSGEPIELTTAYPDFHDMNGDGLTDMVVGSANGRIACFVNSGTTEQPVFNHMENLRADGEEVYFYSYVRPTVCDWNADGYPDMLVADYTGMIYLYLGNPQMGVEQSEEPIQITVNNPVTDLLNFSIFLAEPAEAVVNLYSLGGRLVRSESFRNLPQGHAALNLEVSDLPSGCYTVQVSSGRFTEMKSVILLN